MRLGSEQNLTQIDPFSPRYRDLKQALTGSYPEAYDHYLLLSLPPSSVGVLSCEGFDWVQVLPEGAEHCVVRPGGLGRQFAL